MHQPQLFFDQILALKKQSKDIKASMADALKNSKTYQDRLYHLQIIRSELKMIKAEIEEEFTKELGKLDEIKDEVFDKNIAISDVVLSKITNGEEVTVVDRFGWIYEPVITVKFKKTGEHKDVAGRMKK